MTAETYSGGMTPETTTGQLCEQVGPRGGTGRGRVHVVGADALETATELGWPALLGRAVREVRDTLVSLLRERRRAAAFRLFAPQVWLGETVIAVSLVLGLLGRLGGILCFLMGINLYLANSRIEASWSWSYVFIALLGAVFAATLCRPSTESISSSSPASSGSRRGIRNSQGSCSP